METRVQNGIVVHKWVSKYNPFPKIKENCIEVVTNLFLTGAAKKINRRTVKGKAAFRYISVFKYSLNSVIHFGSGSPLVVISPLRYSATSLKPFSLS